MGSLEKYVWVEWKLLSFIDFVDYFFYGMADCNAISEVLEYTGPVYWLRCWSGITGLQF